MVFLPKRKVDMPPSSARGLRLILLGVLGVSALVATLFRAPRYDVVNELVGRFGHCVGVRAARDSREWIIVWHYRVDKGTQLLEAPLGGRLENLGWIGTWAPNSRTGLFYANDTMMGPSVLFVQDMSGSGDIFYSRPMSWLERVQRVLL